MQRRIMSDWLVTLRKHRNYALRERSVGYKSNNQDAEAPIVYGYGAYCDIADHSEWFAACPLTCPILKHGVLPNVELTKQSKGKTVWGSASDIQMKRTTQLRAESQAFNSIDSDVLQRNIARLDVAFKNFYDPKLPAGYPQFKTTATFNSFEYKPNRVKVRGESKLYFPGIGEMRFFKSRAFPEEARMRTVTVIRDVEDWYVSILFDVPNELPDCPDIEDCVSNVSYDLGINKLASLTDGSHIENPRFATNRRIRRRLRIRQRRVSRKVKGSQNRAKAGKRVAKLHQKIRNQRKDYQWKAAHKIVGTADSVGRENLNIKGMKARCKPNQQQGRFLSNGQSAKRGLNRSISDAAWGELNQKVDWIAAKQGKPVAEYPAPHTSQECSACGHISPNNREGEKFLCEECGHIDHADTQASRNGQKRLGLNFVSTRRENLRGDSAKVTPISYDSAPRGKRGQGGNPILKQLDLFAESGVASGIDRSAS